MKENLRSADVTLFKGVGKFCHFEDLVEGVLKQNMPAEEAVYAGRYKDERDLHSDAQASIVVDQKSFQILHGKNIHKPLQAASLSMVLSTLVILERMPMDTVVCMTAEDIQDAKGSATAKLKAGEKYSVKDLLAASLLRSAADAMLALARHTAGTVDAFVAMMNDRAAELGAVSSYFATPTGKNNRRHYTTVFDLALILREALKRADFRELAFATEMQIIELESGAERVLKTNNRLLFHEKKHEYLDYYCAQALGIKAGANRSAGDCLMSVREYETDRYILGISLGSRDYDYNKLSYLDMARLLTFPYKL